jgi:uncharacterized protein with NRDE domain
MCLLIVAWMSHPRYRLVVAGNRDEFHAREAAPLGWWNDGAGILAGRDLRAGGTWLGVSRSGRFGTVTNYRDADAAVAPGAPSRGELVPSFLRDERPPGQFVAALPPRAASYAGFNLLVADAAGLHYYSNVGDSAPRSLPPGIYGLSNHRLDEPWPKLVRTRERIAAVLADADPDPAALLDALADREPAPARDRADESDLPRELERALSAPFVRHDLYGTRCSTAVLVERGGRTLVHERRFDAAGAQSGAGRIVFDGPGA